MSNVVLFCVKDHIEYETQNVLSQNIIKYCLKNKKGVVFNFLGYCDNILSEMKPEFYFLVSDDFIQLNSEYLTISDIKNINSSGGKRKFFSKFCFFDEICDILKKFNLKNYSLLIISDGSINSVNECDIKDICSDSIVEVLYNSIINHMNQFYLDFPNILINIKKNEINNE